MTPLQARFRGRDKYYPGVIAKVRFDGTFDIDYDDGEKEERVEKELIRAVKGGGIYPVTQTLSLSTHYDTYTLSINTLYGTPTGQHTLRQTL